MLYNNICSCIWVKGEQKGDSTMQEKLTPSFCPKSGKYSGGKKKCSWVRWILPITGLSAFVWFLVRVVPKPSRATYPCQRVAMPLASGFVAWLAGLAVSVFACKKAKQLLKESRVALACLCFVIAGAAGDRVTHSSSGAAVQCARAAGASWAHRRGPRAISRAGRLGVGP